MIDDLNVGRELRQQLGRAAHATDARDWDAVADVFAEDVHAVLGRHGEQHGRTALVEALRSLIEPLDLTQHLVGSILVTGHGERWATTRSHVVAQHVRAGALGGDHYLAGARYDDRFVLREGGWQIGERTLRSLWSRGNRAVLTPGSAPPRSAR